MDRHQPRLAELRPPNPQDPFVQVHVLPIDGHHFANAHAGDCEQAEDRCVSAALQVCGRSELTGSPDESRDLRVAVDVGPLADITAGQQAGGRHFRASIHGAEPESEPTHHPEPTPAAGDQPFALPQGATVRGGEKASIALTSAPPDESG
jgi:hypothetical protein